MASPIITNAFSTPHAASLARIPNLAGVSPEPLEPASGRPSISDEVPSYLPSPQLDTFSIFAATWNMGESRVPDSGTLASWLPPRRLIYVISLQVWATGDTGAVAQRYSVG